MIIVLKSGVGDADVDAVCRRVTEMGYAPHIIRGEFKTIVAAVGEERGRQDLRLLEAMESVESVMPVQQPFKLASREVRPEPSEVRVNDVVIGGKAIVVMAGPCSVESEAQVLEVAAAVKGAGAKILRGGAYKPRTSPYAFQGLKEQGLRFLAEARKRTGLPVVTEVLETGAAQARHGHQHPGVPALGRVHPLGGQPQRDPLRARHPHLRDRDALHP
jgi:3-deoxy-7-phosphoheptulonate synthase